MRALVHRKTLVNVLAAIKPAVLTKNYRPILKSVKLVVTGDTLTITATDLEVAVAAPVSAQVKQPGQCVVSHKALLAAAKGMKDDDVLLAVEKVKRGETECDTFFIAAAGSRLDLAPESADDFPETPPPPDGWKDFFSIGTKQLHQQLRKVAFATAKETSKFAMTGVLCEFNGSAKLVATDSKRLALSDGKIEKSGEPKDAKLIIPNQCVELLLALTKAECGDVWVSAPEREHVRETKDEEGNVTKTEKWASVNEAWFLVNSGAAVYTRLVEGRYPPYVEVFPRKFRVKACVGRKVFIEALTAAKKGCDETDKRVAMRFEDGWLTLTGQSLAGKSESRVAAQCDHTFKINFDPDYLIDAASVCDNDDLAFEFVDHKRSAMIVEGTTKHLIMPLS